MALSKKLKNWILDHNANLCVAGIISIGFPEFFLKRFYNNNRGQVNLWKAKKACMTISFDCDYPRDVAATPILLKILSKYNFKTSFACVGYWIEQYPKEHAMILEYGHEIMNHTFSHPNNEILNPGRDFKNITRAEKSEEIRKCHEICKRILKYEPIGCRIPHFKSLFTDEIYGILKELGYIYSSSTWTMNTKSSGLPFKTKDGILEFPLSTCPRHPFTVFDTWHSLNSPRLFYRLIHRTEDQYIVLAQKLIDLGIENNSYINIYIDPFDVTRMKRFEQLLEYIQSKEDELWVVNYQEIVNTILRQ